MAMNLLPLGLWPIGTESAAAAKTAPATATKQACQNFEAYFTASLFSAMAKSLDLGSKEGWMKSQSEWAWNGLLQQVADSLSQGEGLGLARILEEELARRALAVPKNG